MCRLIGVMAPDRHKRAADAHKIAEAIKQPGFASVSAR
ncbi:hypothetical protein MGSAQ_000773, partial [marine sediment metagenome]